MKKSGKIKIIYLFEDEEDRDTEYNRLRRNQNNLTESLEEKSIDLVGISKVISSEDTFSSAGISIVLQIFDMNIWENSADEIEAFFLDLMDVEPDDADYIEL